MKSEKAKLMEKSSPKIQISVNTHCSTQTSSSPSSNSSNTIGQANSQSSANCQFYQEQYEELRLNCASGLGGLAAVVGLMLVSGIVMFLVCRKKIKRRKTKDDEKGIGKQSLAEKFKNGRKFLLTGKPEKKSRSFRYVKKRRSRKKISPTSTAVLEPFHPDQTFV